MGPKSAGNNKTKVYKRLAEIAWELHRPANEKPVPWQHVANSRTRYVVAGCMPKSPQLG